MRDRDGGGGGGKRKGKGKGKEVGGRGSRRVLQREGKRRGGTASDAGEGGRREDHGRKGEQAISPFTHGSLSYCYCYWHGNHHDGLNLTDRKEAIGSNVTC